MRKFLVFGLLFFVLLGACAAPASDQEAANPQRAQVITVYRSPT